MAKAYSFTDVVRPTSPTATGVAGGSLVDGTTYYYRVYKVNASGATDTWGGKSLPSDEFTFTAGATNKTARISFSCPKIGGSYRIYRATSSAAFTTTYLSNINFFPSDALYNSGGTVTFDDTGYTAPAANNFYEWQDFAHGFLTITGSTSSDKFSITDLYNADVAGGWGIIIKLDENTYKVNCYLVATNQYWYDFEKTIIFADGMLNPYDWKLGNISGENTSAGCNLIFKQNAFSSVAWTTLNAYRTTFTYKFPVSPITGGDLGTGLGVTSGSFNAGTMQDCTIDRFRGFVPISAGCVLNNCIFSRFDNLFSASTATFNGVKCLSGSRVWQISGSNVNVVARGVYATANAVLILNSNATSSLKIINSTVTGAINTNGLVSTGFRLYDQISFNLNVVDSNGTAIPTATVQIYDKDNVLIVDTTTATSGSITEQIISRLYYEVSGTSVLPVNNRYPFLIVISKTGYETYTEKVSYLSSLAVVKTVALKTGGFGNTMIYDSTLIGSSLY